jgi:DNA-binding response OmpR family regulator
MTTDPPRADVLIVDDTPANLNVLAAILGKQGYRVRPAISGELALKTAQKSPPDVVLLDIQMPDLDGYEVCRLLKADPRTAAAPVIFISALEDAIDKVTAFQAGGADYITKPFQIEEVLARVENQLTLRRQQGTIAALEAYRAQVARAVEQELEPALAQILAAAESLAASDDPARAQALVASLESQALALRAGLAALLGER